MKRFLPIVPLFLLVLLNACGDDGVTVPSIMGTAVAHTQTATVWTLTISPTPDPNESKIVEWLNEELSKADPLEQTLDAKYQVVDVLFPVASGSTSAIFLVNVRCECAAYTQCCIPERTFVVAVTAMKKRADKIMEQMPGNVGEMKVVCYDHITPVGAMSAWWSDAKDYLLDQINGYQLGARVFRSTLP